MGIYPTTNVENRAKHPDGTETWTEVYNDFSGVIRRRQVKAEVWAEDERTNCFCCSCPEFGNSDPFCRNHGFAGTRPCEEHGMPGDFDPEMTEGMPRSVQVERAAQKREAVR
jgi:hypothetical protein